MALAYLTILALVSPFEGEGKPSSTFGYYSYLKKFSLFLIVYIKKSHQN
jgi:hypothetical protein